MYVVNVDESISPDKLYKTNGVVANWLIYQKHFSPLGKSKDGAWVFAKTELLLEVMEQIPFYLNITRMFDNL